MPTPIRGRDPILTNEAINAVLLNSPNAVRRGDVSLYTAEMLTLCGAFNLRATVLLAQAWHETGAFGPSGRWRELNPAGLGITNDADRTPYTILDGAEAAALHVWSMLVALRDWANAERLILPPAANGWKQRWSAKYRDPECPVVNNLEDLNQIYDGNRATWATDPAYHTKTLAVMKRLFPATGESENAEVSIPVTPPPLRIAITPYNNTNRPKLVMASPTWITVHEVGNTSPGANEEMHRIFVHNGGGQHNVSFHFVVGPTEAIQLLPLDEAAWHASDGGNGPGNRDSVAIETIQIGDFNRTLWHLAWLINEIATNPQRFAFNQPRQWDFSINHIKQHHDWAPDGKNCPQFIRDRGLWPELMRRVDLWHAISTPGGSGPEPLPEPEPEAKHTLPAGMTPQLASRLFGSYVAPWDDTVFAFDLNQAPSQVWLARGKRSIPKGKDWSEGDWPELNVVIRRGDGNQVWTWSDGSTYERKLA